VTVAPALTADAGAVTDEHEDGEARITQGRSRGEFATRRGGRRRRRPGAKAKPETNGTAATEAGEEPLEVTGIPDEPAISEMADEPVEVALPATPPPAPAPERQQRDRRPTSNRANRNIPRRERHQPTITDLLKEGQEILVQIAKEPIAKKGARITSHIALYAYR